MADFKQIAAYMDQLHRDIGQLMILTEKLMGDAGYISLPSAGNRATWRLSSHFEYPNKWRVLYLARCYIPDDEEETFTESYLFLIVLRADTQFDFPPVICARITHPPLTEGKIYNHVFLPDRFKTLATSRSDWHDFNEEAGWIVAEPTFKTPLTKISTYILNLFEISDQQKVLDNIVKPLVEGGALTEMLTLPTYPITTKDAL